MKLFTNFVNKKTIHSRSFLLIVDKAVDSVDKLAISECFANLYNVSRPHCYQQITRG